MGATMRLEFAVVWAHTAGTSRLAWAGRHTSCCRPVQARRLDLDVEGVILRNDRSTCADVAVADAGVAIVPDPRRLVVRFFVAGLEDVGPGDSRARSVIDRILRLDDDELGPAMASVDDRFGDRHPSLHETFERHAAAGRLPVRSGDRRDDRPPPAHRRGVHQRVRRRGRGAVQPVDRRPPRATRQRRPGVRAERPRHRRGPRVVDRLPVGRRIDHRARSDSTPLGAFLAGASRRRGFTIAACSTGSWPSWTTTTRTRRTCSMHSPSTSTTPNCSAASPRCMPTRRLRRHTSTTIAHLEHLVRCSYTVRFCADSELSERVLWPHSPTERHGMEDARFVEITDASAPRYCATYTAYDGTTIKQGLLTTDDFATFAVSPMAGNAARGKGLALFPRQVDGRYAALTRADRETNSIAYSDDLRCWDTAAGRPAAASSVGGPPARQLRVPDRDIRRLARAHARSRPDADLFDRCDPARPRRTPPRDRRARAALPHARPERPEATSRTSSTRAARSGTAIGSSSRTGSATRPSPSPRCRSAN